MREGTVVEVGEDLLDDGVAAVLLFGLDHLEGAVGEYRVITPDREQFGLPGWGAGVQVADTGR